MAKAKGLLAWRSRQSRGKIMRPATFRRIEKSAETRGADNPKAVAGAAYWKTARAKHRRSSRAHKRSRVRGR